MKPFILFLILVFLITSSLFAETSNSIVTPEVKKEIIEKMKQLKNTEKPGLRSPEELTQELFFHIVINSTLTAICEPVIKEPNIQKRKEKN